MFSGLWDPPSPKTRPYQLPAAVRIRLVRTVSHSFPSRLHFNLLNFEPPSTVISFSTSRYIDGSELIWNIKKEMHFGRGRELLRKPATTIRSKTTPSLRMDLSIVFSVESGFKIYCGTSKEADLWKSVLARTQIISLYLKYKNKERLC